MTVQIKRVLLALASGATMTLAPMAFSALVVPAIGHADECAVGDSCSPGAKGLNCPDGTIVDEENRQCVDLVAGISKQLQALPAPPSLAGGGGGLGSLGGLSGGIPSLGTVNLPDVVLPSLGLGLVPNLNVALQPQIGGFSAPQAALPNLAALPAPQLPPPPSINPLNPLGLPPPPDLTPGIPFI
ncbi:hypothetical protein TUM20985_31000 [Mycobacterium antarcticum]|uniref:hypothetical protein n=1 Tax=unclassified Mycolicibacterium TaxID=2636767 RepID=UPI0023886174|nr:MULTISPECIES: hypothetical protein [unclassified Mycolicibacterium]BDX32553.1 hypothetical protein TUM20985_31000 [Mycolicibacterium sp. TUM20985]GLP75762.1 hypothetical protein TUM20983_28720 [Mycolicibacterium sp. TUM20983]GLP83897.1 hypothetical protein TUM20984_53170 [Mycolicibacterium sp. TUM20984]